LYPREASPKLPAGYALINVMDQTVANPYKIVFGDRADKPEPARTAANSTCPGITFSPCHKANDGVAA